MSTILLLTCRDTPGVVAAVTTWIFEHGGNIIHAEQHVGVVDDSQMLYQRIEFDCRELAIAREAIAEEFQTVADRFDMTVDVRFGDVRPRIALLASRQPHCLLDLMTRCRNGELHADVSVVVSNHPDHAAVCAHMEVPYVHLPVTKETKADQERSMLAVLAEHHVELVVLARYMQILSQEFLTNVGVPIINIHHSFLPAFMGANPYRQAYERGVKLIGATGHYATADLDEGPIIEQETARVSHRNSVQELTMMGKDLETLVLARSVRAHIDHRVLVVAENKTVVFA